MDSQTLQGLDCSFYSDSATLLSAKEGGSGFQQLEIGVFTSLDVLGMLGNFRKMGNFGHIVK